MRFSVTSPASVTGWRANAWPRVPFLASFFRRRDDTQVRSSFGFVLLLLILFHIASNHGSVRNESNRLHFVFSSLVDFMECKVVLEMTRKERLLLNATRLVVVSASGRCRCRG